jgi:hypothetical protein
MPDEEAEEPGEAGQGQNGDWYGCSCGDKFPTRALFISHLGHPPKDDKEHKSIGRIDAISGAVTMPPWNQRTKEQKEASRFAKRTQTNATQKNPSAIPTSILTSNVDVAQSIKFVPRVMSVDMTTILRLAPLAAHNEWGWPLVGPDLPLEDFIDTCINGFFKDRGIILQGYINLKKPEGQLVGST